MLSGLEFMAVSNVRVAQVALDSDCDSDALTDLQQTCSIICMPQKITCCCSAVASPCSLCMPSLAAASFSPASAAQTASRHAKGRCTLPLTIMSLTSGHVCALLLFCDASPNLACHDLVLPAVLFLRPLAGDLGAACFACCICDWPGLNSGRESLSPHRLQPGAAGSSASLRAGSPPAAAAPCPWTPALHPSFCAPPPGEPAKHHLLSLRTH